ncbi:hypothetical protein [Catellatospora sichuanensis]|uniref:hypothetical protein n=1 Tax=Catellatospora sichuanensis TaxID=1969805 RepID=UPI001183B9E2|nr:hypothetical protein [Catellatospora sichuanensis]
MSDTVFIVGGPKHGQRMSSYEQTYALNMAEMRKLNAYDFGGRVGDIYHRPTGPSFDVVTYPIIRIPIGSRFVKVAHHPDITEETAKRYVGDLMYAAWEKSTK